MRRGLLPPYYRIWDVNPESCHASSEHTWGMYRKFWKSVPFQTVTDISDTYISSECIILREVTCSIMDIIAFFFPVRNIISYQVYMTAVSSLWFINTLYQILYTDEYITYPG